jgi:hypothetical protein
MLDTSHLPPSSFSKTDIFYCVAQSSTTTNSWQTWVKPRGCSWVYIFALGGGGGGGSPNTGSVQGGGGGGVTSCLRHVIPAPLLPDNLYVRVGNGGAGATSANSSGTAGTRSLVGVYPLDSAGCNIGLNAGGSAGSATTGGGATSVTVYNYAYLGFVQGNNSLSGGNGGASGSAGAAATYAISTTQIPMCGAGGGAGYNGSAASAGGAITFAVSYPALTIPGGTAGVGVPGGRGGDGYGANKRLDFNGPQGANVLFFTGGSGGGCSDTAGQAGGRGGDGGYGCGGGGGGGASATPGNGGNGGDGLVIICSW